MTSTRTLFFAVIVVGVIAIGAYYYPTVNQNAGSPAGTVFNTAKFAGVSVDLSAPGANGTSTSILNTDSGSRYVTGYRYGCSGIGTSKTAYTGAGLAALTLTIGTTTTSAPAAAPSQAFLIANGVTMATSSANNAQGSSTPTVALGNATIWPAGSYMTFATNATNTARCTMGVDYLGS